MEPYQERMLDELNELAKKTEKLNAFINSDKYKALPKHKRVLMMLQFNAMNQYATILVCRCVEEGLSVEELLKE